LMILKGFQGSSKIQIGWEAEKQNETGSGIWAILIRKAYQNLWKRGRKR